MVRDARRTVLIVLVAVSAACKSKSATQDAPASSAPQVVSTANLADLSTSLDAVRVEFNAHKKEARFLTLLAPT